MIKWVKYIHILQRMMKMRLHNVKGENLIIQLNEEELAVLSEAIEKGCPDPKLLADLDHVFFDYYRKRLTD